MNRSKLFHRLKYIITGIAGINLILLFVFHYELPSFLQYKLDEARERKIASESTEDTNKLTLHFDPEELTYSGSGDLNLTKGVTVYNGGTTTVQANLFTYIQKGDTANKKIITYIAEDSSGKQGTAKRTLILEDYEGPSITLTDARPGIDDTELSILDDIFFDMGILSADDGYGNDITSSIETSYVLQNADASSIRITFDVTNMFGDKTSTSIDLPLTRTKPLIVLSKEEDSLSVGDTFTPVSYIASATDRYGTDISPAVVTEGTVDTSKAGTYRITYKLTDANGAEADPVSLKITVN